MPAPANCPFCGSDDINYSAKHGDWVCADCAHRFDAPPSEAVPVPPDATDDPLAPAVAAFISYGHADGSDFAARLKAELETRGVAPLWLDSEMIASGDDFWAAMQVGIAGSDVLLAVMTPSSLREGSVCWREMAFADDRGKRIVPVRIDADPALRPNVLLVGRSWADFTSSPWSDAVERLLRGLSGEDAALRSVGVIGGIAPLRFAEEVSRHLRRFSGREWLDAELDEWLRSDTGRAFVIVGEPGIGKSAIAAHLTTRDDVVAWHFCTARGYDRSLNPQEFVASVVSALSQRLPAFAAALASRHPELPREDAGSAFRELVVEPAQAIESPPSPQLLVVDALDEAATRTGEGGTIVDLIAAHASSLPSWLRIVATSRPEAAVISKLKALRPIELAADRTENLEDVAAYLAARLTGVEAVPEGEREGVARALADKAAGNFLWATMAADALEEGVFSADEVSGIPIGLGAFYSLAFARAFPDPEAFLRDYAPALRPLTAAFAPVPVEVLALAANLDASTLNLRLIRLRSYLKVQGAGADVAYSLFHRSLSEWLADRDASAEYWCDTRAGHEQMAAALRGDPLGSNYATRWMPRHLVALGRWQQVEDLLVLPEFLLAATRLNRFEPHRLWSQLQDEGSRDVAQAYLGVLDGRPMAAGGLRTVAVLLFDLGCLEASSRFYEEAIREAETRLSDVGELVSLQLSQARVLRSMGDLEAALDAVAAAENHAEAAGDLPAHSRCLGDRVWLLKLAGRKDEALTCLAQQERVLRGIGWAPAVAQCLEWRAILSDGDDKGVALDELERFCRENGLQVRLVKCLGRQVVELHRRSRHTEAEALLTEAQRMLREDVAATDRLAALGGLAEAVDGSVHQTDTLQLLATRASLLRDLDEPLLLADCLRDQADALCERRNLAYLDHPADLDQALRLLEEEEGIRRSLGDALGVGSCLERRGDIFRTRQDKATAAALFSDAERIWRRVGAPRRLAWALERKALVLAESDSGQSVALRREQIALLRSVGDSGAVAGALDRLAYALREADPSAADECYEEATALYRALGRLDDLKKLVKSRCYWLGKAGRWADAAVAWHDSATFLAEAGDPSGTVDALVGEANACAKMGDVQSADKAYRLAEERARDSGYRRNLVSVAEGHADLLDKAHRTGEAIEVLENAVLEEIATDEASPAIMPLGGGTLLKLAEFCVADGQHERALRWLDRYDLQHADASQAAPLSHKRDRDCEMRLRTQALKSLGRSAEALSMWEGEARRVRKTSEPPDVAEFLFEEAKVALDLGDPSCANAHLDEAERVCRGAGDASCLHRLPWNLLYHARSLQRADREEEALETLRRSADLFVEFADAKGRFISSWEIVKTLRRVSRYAEAFSELDRAEKLAVETSPNLDALRMIFDLGMGMQSVEVESYAEDLGRWRHGLRATLLADVGSLEEAYADLEDRERTCVEEGDEGGIAYTYARRAYVAARAGAPIDEVIGCLRTSHEHAVRSDSGHKPGSWEAVFPSAPRVVIETIEDIERAGMTTYGEPLRALRDELVPPDPHDV